MKAAVHTALAIALTQALPAFAQDAPPSWNDTASIVASVESETRQGSPPEPGLPAEPVATFHNDDTLTRAVTATRAAEPQAAPASQAAAEANPVAGERAADAADLAKKLQNPIAALVSVPFQSNWDYGAGPDGNGYQYKMNFQPVIPVSLNEKWNLIARIIVPWVDQHDTLVSAASPLPPKFHSQSGLGDITATFFFSPKAPTQSGWIWGVGPVFLLPVATDDLLGTEKWGVGPSAIVLKQEHGWTYGALVNHIWSVAGEDDRADVSATFLQPFLLYTTSKHTTFGVSTESTYDWKNSQWKVPVNLIARQLVKIGKRPVQFELNYRKYVEGPEDGPDWGLRFTVSLLFPK